jgi:hypothetical protein
MNSANTNDSPKPDAGLPPVQPPSARFIGQLFVIPGLIVLVIVGLCLFSNVLFKKQRGPGYFLQQLDSSNLDIRWRGASDLAQILKRPEPAALRWKADATFALDLAERLDSAYKDLLDEERNVANEIAKSNDKDKNLLWRKVRPKRDMVSFLASALGEFHVPVGAPLLCTIAGHESAGDANGNTLQRRQAMWALINMGEQLKGFAKMPKEQQEMTLEVLRAEARKGTTPRANWARTALHYVDPTSLRFIGQDGVTLVDEALVKLAESDDRYVRELVAMAFNFWDGPKAEATLLKLTHDNGHGTLIRVVEND